jgi:transcriptional regulator NrdR family protein
MNTSQKACPKCHKRGTSLCLDSRPRVWPTYRRYRCEACLSRWTTYEVLGEDYKELIKNSQEYARLLKVLREHAELS